MLLGHRDLEETTIYLHLSERHLSATGSPLDSLELKDRPLPLSINCSATSRHWLVVHHEALVDFPDAEMMLA
jgi:hypothetical protein